MYRTTTNAISQRRSPAWQRLCCVCPLLFGIAVWLGSLGAIGIADLAWADNWPSHLPAERQVELAIDSDYLPIELQPPLIHVAIDSTAITSAQIFTAVSASNRPHHTDLLTADNYTVSVHGDREPIADKPLQELAIESQSQIVPTYIKARVPISCSDRCLSAKLGKSQSISRVRSRDIPAKTKSPAGLASNIVVPMKPRATAIENSRRQRQQLSPEIDLNSTRSIERSRIKSLAETRSPDLRATTLAYNEPTPNIVTTSQPAKGTKPDRADDVKRQLASERLATIAKLAITDPSFKAAVNAPPLVPKQQIPVSERTKIAFGARIVEASDLADTVNPLFDLDDKTKDKDPLMISKFGSRAGIYYLVAGSGVGVRHQFSPSLEGSVGILARSFNDGIVAQNNRSNQGMKSNTSLNNNRQTASSSFDISFDGDSLIDSYGTIAQLTYKPSDNLKVGLTYVYAYNVNPEIGTESANITDGVNSAIGIQSFWRANSNLAVGGWMNFNRNRNPEIDKNIVTWAVTAGIPDLGGKGNLAGIIVGQEPRTISASNPEAIDRGAAWHLEAFYKLAIDKDLSITPAITYITGPNIDNIEPGKSDIIGAIGINYRF